tara:strand:- start:279 stop:452 length:174 start_codon:yes stop_codon:yes gene_type:complete
MTELETERTRFNKLMLQVDIIQKSVEAEFIQFKIDMADEFIKKFKNEDTSINTILGD